MVKCVTLAAMLTQIYDAVSRHLAIRSYRQTSITRGTLVGNKLVDLSDVVGAGTAPTTSSFST